MRPIPLNISLDENQAITPAWGEEAVRVALATDLRYAPYAAVALKSIVDAASPERYYDLVVLETGLTEAVKEQMMAMTETSGRISLRFYNLSQTLKGLVEHLFVSAHLSPAAYYRLLAPAIFQAPKLIYLDVDLVVRRDVAPLYDVDLGPNLVGAVRDYFAVKDLLANPDGAWARQLGLADFSGYFNSGVMVLNLAKMRDENFNQTWLNHLQRIKTPRLHDQDILNSCCQGRVKYLPSAWNCQAWNEELGGPLDNEDLPGVWLEEYDEGKIRPHIIHYLSRHKPWQVPQVPLAEYFWQSASTTPFYNQLILENLTHLNREMGRLKSQQRWPLPALKLWFYKLMSRFGSAGRKLYFRDKVKKLHSKRSNGW